MGQSLFLSSTAKTNNQNRNYAMDHCSTWHHISSITLPESFNVVLHSNGGARPHRGAASWIAEASYFDELASTWVLQVFTMKHLSLLSLPRHLPCTTAAFFSFFSENHP